MTPHLTTLKQPSNVVSFLENGTACVVFFPYARELIKSEWERIDAARRIRFFLYACPDAPMPPGQSGGGGRFGDYYPGVNVRSAIDRTTYMFIGILAVPKRFR